MNKASVETCGLNTCTRIGNYIIIIVIIITSTSISISNSSSYISTNTSNPCTGNMTQDSNFQLVLRKSKF